ncbi:hypothetical protein LTR22_019759 [Elasticomyces elasticus]|nr:hypothetical protein LTR22_019759 [Elasticomyces elasticus]
MACTTQARVDDIPVARLPSDVSPAWRPTGTQHSALLQLSTDTFQQHARTNNPAFVWSRIDSGSHFRLLTIIPGRPRPEDRPADAQYSPYRPSQGSGHERIPEYETLECTLHDVERGKSPAYTAISYTWGDTAKQAAHITCNLQAMDVTENCYVVLSTLRRLGLYGPFWLDAICIAQSDTLERSAQVTRMGDIFRQAPSTIVFLCEQPYDGGRAPAVALPALRYLPGDIEELRSMSGSELYDDYASLERSSQETAKRGTMLRPEIFYYSPWFTRTWIVEELMLAQQLDFVTEDSESLVPWSIVLKAYRQWRERSLLSDIPDIILMRHPRLKNRSSSALQNIQCDTRSSVTSRINDSIVPGTTAFDPQRLFDVLEATRHFKCSDRKDKLFAVLPLFSNTPDLLRPDYLQSTFEVYRNLTWSFLQHNVSDILSLASFHHSHGGLSWVVDWSDATPQAQRLIHYHHGTEWSAGCWPDRREVYCLLSSDDRALTLRGRSVGQVGMNNRVKLGDGGSAQIRTRQYAARPGDLACIFLGFKVPFMLRYDDGILRLVDECEIEGIMEGQALKDVDRATAYDVDPTGPLEDFEIN